MLVNIGRTSETVAFPTESVDEFCSITEDGQTILFTIRQCSSSSLVLLSTW